MLEKRLSENWRVSREDRMFSKYRLDKRVTLWYNYCSVITWIYIW